MLITLYTVEEVARLLKASRSTIYELMEEGKLAYVNVGVKKGRRIRHDDLERFLDANRVEGKTVEVPPLRHVKLSP